jgi:hypothetical protein
VIDVRKVRTLGHLLLKLEIRGKSGSNRKLLAINISYLIPGILLPWILMTQNTDPSGFEFTFATYIFFSAILAFTIITELDSLVISGAESGIFSIMPVDDRLLASAKMFMLLRYSAFLCIPLLIPGSVYFYFMMKSLPRAFLYFASGYLLCFFLINIIALLYSWALKIFKSKRLSAYTLAFQLIMILSLILGYQLIASGFPGKQFAGIGEYLNVLKKTGIIDYLPQSWYALLPARNNYVPGFALMFKVFLPILICYLSYFSLKLYLIENYKLIREKFQELRTFEPALSGKERFLIFRAVSDFIETVYLRNSLERSSYGLMMSLYKSEKSVRLAVLPMILIPVGLAFFAFITGQLPPPIETVFPGPGSAFHISILIASLVCISTALKAVKVTNYRGAWWIYDSYPVEQMNHFKNGFRKFFVVKLIIPVCILLGLIFLVKIPLHIAVLHTLFIFAAANVYNSLYCLLSRKLPFTKENTLLNSMQRIAGIIYPLLYGTVIVLVQLFVYRTVIASIIAVLALITINLWLNYFGFARAKK